MNLQSNGARRRKPTAEPPDKFGGITLQYLDEEGQHEDVSAPHNTEVEQALLGAILVQNQVYHRVASIVAAKDFYDEIHGQIFETAGRLISEGRSAKPSILGPHFDNCDFVGELTVKQYLGRLACNAITVISAPDYARTIRELAMRRRLQESAREILAGAANQAVGLAELAAESVDTANYILANLGDGKRTDYHVSEAVSKALDALDNGEAGSSIATGLIDLDRRLGGFHKGETIIVAGRTSMGKTLLAASLSLAIARRGHGVGYFSLEMPAHSLGQRIISDLAWSQQAAVPYPEIRNRQVDEAGRKQLSKAAEGLSEIPLVIEEKPGLTVAEIAAKARVMSQNLERKGRTLELIVVDHIGKIRPSSRYAGRKVEETGETMGALAALAKDMDLPIMILSQINRAVEGEKNKRPNLSHLAWSGQLEQDADTILLLYRDCYYLERARENNPADEADRMAAIEACRYQLEISIAKQRSGPLGTVTVFCDPACNVVRDGRADR